MCQKNQNLSISVILLIFLLMSQITHAAGGVMEASSDSPSLKGTKEQIIAYLEKTNPPILTSETSGPMRTHIYDVISVFAEDERDDLVKNILKLMPVDDLSGTAAIAIINAFTFLPKAERDNYTNKVLDLKIKNMNLRNYTRLLEVILLDSNQEKIGVEQVTRVKTQLDRDMDAGLSLNHYVDRVKELIRAVKNPDGFPELKEEMKTDDPA